MVSTNFLLSVYQFLEQGIVFKLLEDEVKVSAKQILEQTEKDNVINFVAKYKDRLRQLLLENNNMLSSALHIIKYDSNKDKAPLSFAQERLWFLDQYEKNIRAYNIPLLFEMPKNIDAISLEKSLLDVISRHEILHTLIKKNQEGEGYQQVVELNREMLSLRQYILNSEGDLKNKFAEEAAYCYELDREYPIRIALYKNTSNHLYYLSVIIHHIACDGWSIPLFIKELQACYFYHAGRISQEELGSQLPKLDIQYSDFALWQRAYLTQDLKAMQLNYWKSELNDYIPLNLITDKVRPKQIDYAGADVFFEIDESISMGLRKLAKNHEVSLYSILLSGFYLFLKTYSYQDDITVGSAVANRHYPQVENLIGCFVNSLALRIKIDSSLLVSEFLEIVGGKVTQAQLNQDLPFEQLVEALQLPKDSSRHPIFQIIFGLHTFDHQEEVMVGNTNIIKRYQGIKDRSNAKFDLSVYIDDSQPTLRGQCNFATALYTEKTIRNFICTYKHLLKQLSNSLNVGDMTLADLSYLDKQQYQKIVYQWNKTEKDYLGKKTIHQFFEDQVIKTPKSIAVLDGDTSLTYCDLNEKANKLAHYIKEKYCIISGDFVAFFLDRSTDVLVAILGVLKAGGAYVPIDPNYPNDRISYILSDTQARLLLTQHEHNSRLISVVQQLKSDAAPDIISINQTAFQQTLMQCSAKNGLNNSNLNDLAYVIYTSGTTGKPKGVMIEHEAALNYIHNLIDYVYASKSQLNIDYSTNAAFDLTVSTTLATLLSGHKVCAYRGDNKDVAMYIQHLVDCKVNLVKHVPSYFELVIDLLSVEQMKKLSLAKIVLGGEKLPKSLIKKILGIPGIKIYEEYGPTETTVGSHTSMIDKIESLASHNLGVPFFNYTNYILDHQLRPVPVGAIGELYIGGAGLARGYLNQPKMTAENFISDPFCREPKRRLYKTGDLVRWASNGTLDYISRVDCQVKIRGHRIELGEIEDVISQHEGIKQSIVLMHEGANHNKYLVGYYLAASELNKLKILEHCRAKLPDYMIPNNLIYLAKPPLTINGKLDAHALPIPELVDVRNYVAPRNTVETQLAAIWEEILNIPRDKIGVDDDFFRLGGNSILAIKLVSKINNALCSNLKLTFLFQAASIRKIGEAVEANMIVDEGEIV